MKTNWLAFWRECAEKARRNMCGTEMTPRERYRWMNVYYYCKMRVDDAVNK